MTAIDKAILHIVLIIAVLFLFSKLSLDAIVLGALAIYFFQNRRHNDHKDSSGFVSYF